MPQASRRGGITPQTPFGNDGTYAGVECRSRCWRKSVTSIGPWRASTFQALNMAQPDAYF